MKVMPHRNFPKALAIIAVALLSLLCVTASPVQAQDEPNSFSHEVPEQTFTFATVNPYTKANGSMTIVLTGVFRAHRQNAANGPEVSRITGGQRGAFTFVPDDPSQPTISGKFHFNMTGQPQPHSETINFAFRMNGQATDGQRFSFVQHERAVVSEGSFEISFGSTDAVEAQGN